jgi:PAS domain S-box-containing protein
MESEDLENNKFRINAREIAQNRSYPNKDLSKDELIEELRIHQIELELQNEELRESQMKLTDSQNKYFDLYNFSPVGIFNLDKNGIILDVNLSGATLLCAERLKLHNQAFIIFIDPDYRKKFHLHCLKVKESNQKQTVELKLLNKNNDSTYVHLETVSITDKTGELQQFRITANDITNNKKATKDIELASKYNRSLIEASLDPLVTIGSDGKITDVNHSTENVTGYTRDELIGTYFLDYFTEPKKAREGYLKVFKEGFVQDYLLKIKNKNGHTTPVLYNSSVYKDESGEVIGVFAAARDITEIKKAAEENKKLANVVEFSDDAIITKTLDSCILSWNKGAEQIYGYSKEEVIGKSISILAPPELKKEISELILKIKLEENVHHYETLRLKKDGTPMDVSITLSPIFDDSGKLVAISNISRDITERKVAERELNEYRNSLEEKVEKRTKELARSNAELEHFAYIAAHDLREPLRMITSFLQLLEKRYKDQLDQDANEFIDYAVDGAKRLNDMINDLLKYSKVTSNDPKCALVNLEKVLEDALINLIIPTEENNAVITYDSLPKVHGDEKLLILLLQNLVGNGIKYNDKKTPKIHISSIKKDNQYIISVKDNGIGIKPEYLERIFTIFQRLHGKEEYDGTGIGLSIAQKIVHQHHGEIWVESEPGKGSTFYFNSKIN